MKLQELLERQDKGTYAGVSFDVTTTNAIIEYISDNKLPNGVSRSTLHTTLLYSRKYLPKYKAQGKLKTPLIGKPDKFLVWESSGKDGKEKTHCLVLTYKCPELVKRHDLLMDKHEATYDFPEYIPHITFSYDIGDMEIDDLPDVSKVLDEIVIIEEYMENLD